MFKIGINFFLKMMIY